MCRDPDCEHHGSCPSGCDKDDCSLVTMGYKYHCLKCGVQFVNKDGEICKQCGTVTCFNCKKDVTYAVLNRYNEYLCINCFEDLDTVLCQNSDMLVSRSNLDPKTLKCIRCEHPNVCNMHVCANPSCNHDYSPAFDEMYCQVCMDKMSQGICVRCDSEGQVLDEKGLCDDCKGDYLCDRCGRRRVKYLGGICARCEYQLL